MTDYTKLIESNYSDENGNNDVEHIVDDITKHILTTGIYDMTSGIDLADQYCKNLKGDGSKEICGTGNYNKLNKVISSLPIYFLIAHSTVDIPLLRTDMNNGKGKLSFNDTEVYQKIPVTDSLSTSKYLINTTTSGGWGLLDADAVCVPSDHILREPATNIKRYFFKPATKDPDFNCEDRIGLYAKSSDDDDAEEIMTKKYPPLFNLPGTNYIDKIHQFGGDKLTGGGFGIIKLDNPSNTTAQEVVEQWQEQKEEEDDYNERDFENNVYFLTDKGGNISSEDNVQNDNKGVTANDVAIWNLLKENWKFDDYVNEDGTSSSMGASNVKISDIIKLGGPGIYISLSCSEYYFSVNGEKYELELGSDSPDLKLVREITGSLGFVGAINRVNWDSFTGVMNFNPGVNTLGSANPGTASMQVPSHLKGGQKRTRKIRKLKDKKTYKKKCHKKGLTKKNRKYKRQSRKK